MPEGDEAGSGLTLRVAAGGERMRIEEVDAGMLAGIRVGEHRLAIDGAPVRELGLRRVQALLATPDVRLRLRIAGDYGVRDVELALPATRR